MAMAKKYNLKLFMCDQEPNSAALVPVTAEKCVENRYLLLQRRYK